MKTLPKTIYVTREEDTDGSNWLSANESATGLEHGVSVGIYELKQVRKVRVTTDLISKK